MCNPNILLNDIKETVTSLSSELTLNDYVEVMKWFDEFEKCFGSINSELRVYKSRYEQVVSELELEKIINKNLEKHLKNFGDVVKAHGITSEIMRNNESKKVHPL